MSSPNSAVTTLSRERSVRTDAAHDRRSPRWLRANRTGPAAPAGAGLPLRDVVRLGKQLAEAVRLLHAEARIGHFDIKPDNVLLDAAGVPHLCDFSIAFQFPAGQTHMALPQDAYGSTHYMAPEQLTDRFGGVTLRADVWGVACTLLELYTCQAPFAGAWPV
jgi:eukaryotic-like serine/threonine-protein kinase